MFCICILTIHNCREFDEPKKKKKKKAKKASSNNKRAAAEKPADTASDPIKEEPEAKKSKKRKRKTSSDDSVDSNESNSVDADHGASKKKKELSLTERLQQLEAELEEREGKAAEDINVADLDDDVKSNVRKVYEIDKVQDVFD